MCMNTMSCALGALELGTSGALHKMYSRTRLFSRSLYVLFYCFNVVKPGTTIINIHKEYENVTRTMETRMAECRLNEQQHQWMEKG